MPFWIQGWVEVNWFDGPEQEEYGWFSLIDLQPLITGGDEISERLFGLSKRCVTGEFDAAPLAADRGFPSSPSPEVRSAIDIITELERKYGQGGIGGYTYALWREVKTVSFEQNVLDDSDWSLVFDILRRLEQDIRFNEDRIRLVVWYNW